MDFEWDPLKARANRTKHGVEFPAVTAVFSDTRALTIRDSHEEQERYATIGLDVLGRLSVVVYTWRGENIRIISARKATRREIGAYEDER
jgi:hypothetical protein